jgi:uroporphyrinogen decarboxylase
MWQVIGFAGGPWTLMSYMIEGGGSKTYEKSKTWLYRVQGRTACVMMRRSDALCPFLCQHHDVSHRLLAALSVIIIELLVAEYEAGASVLQVYVCYFGSYGHAVSSAVQLFESSAGELSPGQFITFCLPYILDIGCVTSVSAALDELY